ncbi:MAG: zinc ribbon domain-containing protein [Planctomycetota bacterium]
MPFYDYMCRANDRRVEVRHGMTETVTTWGELCARAGIEPGDTPPDAPVDKLISGGTVVPLHTSSSSSSSAAMGPCCGGGACGHNHN